MAISFSRPSSNPDDDNAPPNTSRPPVRGLPQGGSMSQRIKGFTRYYGADGNGELDGEEAAAALRDLALAQDGEKEMTDKATFMAIRNTKLNIYLIMAMSGMVSTAATPTPPPGYWPTPPPAPATLATTPTPTTTDAPSLNATTDTTELPNLAVYVEIATDYPEDIVWDLFDLDKQEYVAMQGFYTYNPVYATYGDAVLVPHGSELEFTIQYYGEGYGEPYAFNGTYEIKVLNETVQSGGNFWYYDNKFFNVTW